MIVGAMASLTLMLLANVDTSCTGSGFVYNGLMWDGVVSKTILRVWATKLLILKVVQCLIRVIVVKMLLIVE